MADRTALDLGAQTRAAQTVADALPDIEKSITDLAGALETGLDGLRGAAGAAFAAAVEAWLEVASGLVPTLGHLAAGLATTDLTAGTADTRESGAFSAICSVLDGDGSRP